MKYDVVTIGDAFEDVFVEPELDVKFDHRFASGRGIAFEFGEKIPLNRVEYAIGGSACNIAVGLSRLGFKTALATVLGCDTPAEKIYKTLEQEKVSKSSSILDKETQTGFSVIFSIKGERTIFVYHGLKDYSKLKIQEGTQSRWYVVTSLGENIGDIEKRIIKEVSENGANFAWNPGSRQISQGATHFRHLLRCCSVLVMNKEESIKFVKCPVRPQEKEIFKLLYQYGVKIVVITDGKRGAMAYDGKQFYEVEASRIANIVDVTGAGDAFATGFIGRIINLDFKMEISNEVIVEALKWGVSNSTSVIQYVGAQRGLLDRQAIVKD